MSRLRKSLRRFHRREDGQTFVFISIAAILIMVVAMVVVDGAHAFVEKRSLQNAVDAASLAGAGKLPTDGTPCGGDDQVPGTCLYDVRTT
ncbi:MAG: pilus assembly protein, partial [Actinomycetota bacterium]|nr:pilus assembly protein [Actinomycetota bacterium]